MRVIVSPVWDYLFPDSPFLRGGSIDSKGKCGSAAGDGDRWVTCPAHVL